MGKKNLWIILGANVANLAFRTAQYATVLLKWLLWARFLHSPYLVLVRIHAIQPYTCQFIKPP